MLFFEKIEQNIKELENLGAKVFSIGKSVLSRDIWCLKIGSGKIKIIAQYAIHAREYITTYLAILHARKLLSYNLNAEIYLVPLVNPDGASLCVDGLLSVPFNYQSYLYKINKSDDFSLWKANVNAVDLNVNFDAKWASGCKNIFNPSSENFVGKVANSEPEVRALINFTEQINPNLTLSFHSKGEVIFYDFYQNLKDKKRDKKIAKIIKKSTGYKILPSGKSAGGYKDWCIEKLKIPAFTIEVGCDSYAHPIGKEKLPYIWKKTNNIFNDLVDYFNTQNLK